MVSIHGRRRMYRNLNRRRHTSAGDRAMRWQQRRCDAGTLRIAQPTSIAQIMLPERPQGLGHHAHSCASALELPSNARPASILSRPAGRIEGCGIVEPHPSIRGSVPLRRHFTATQDAGCRFFVQYDSLGYAEDYSDYTRIAQHESSCQHPLAWNVSLGAAWPGAATPLFRDRIAARVFPGPGTHCAAIVFG